jgi:hypothetical protein
MRKNLKTWFERWFWPTKLALRLPHCYAPHGTKLLYETPALERPPCPNRRGPRLRKAKRVRRYRRANRYHPPVEFPF